jgi:superfamily II DNA or RNA helicase
MNNIRKGDKVLFLLPNYHIYDQEGKDIFEKLKSNNIYTVKEIGIISLSLKEVEGGYLIEHFSKIRK